MPNAAYEVLFSTNAPKVEREIKRLQRQVSDPIVPTVDLKQLKALNAELDLKQSHLRQTIAYFRQNAIAPKFEMSMGQLSPAEVKKALPSSAMAQAGKEAGKTFAKALKGSVESNVIDADIKLLESVKTENIRKQLTDVIKLSSTTKEKLMDIARLASKKGIEFPGVSKGEIKAGFKNVNLDELRQSMMTGMKEAAEDSLHGFVRSLTSGHAAVGAAAAAVGEVAIKMLRNQIRAKSPSKETEEAGKDFVKGFSLGIEKNSSQAIGGVKAMADQAIAEMNRVKKEWQQGRMPPEMPQGARRLASMVNPPTGFAQKPSQPDWFSKKEPIQDPWASATSRFSEKALRDQLKAVGINRLEQKTIDDLRNSYAQVAKTRRQIVDQSVSKVAGLLPAAGQTTASKATKDLLRNIAAMKAPMLGERDRKAVGEGSLVGQNYVQGVVNGINNLTGKAVKSAKDLGRQIVDGLTGEVNKGSSMEQLGKKLAALITNPAYYRRKIKQVGFENLPIEITNAATQRLENPPSRISKLLGIKGDFERQLDAAIAGLRNTAKRAQSTGMIAAGGGGGIAGGGGGRGGGGLSGGGGFGGGFRFDPRDSLRSLQNVINRAEAIAYRTKIDSPQFISMNQLAGRMRGRYERGQNLAERAQLRTSALAFDEGSLTRINKLLQEAQIRASEVAPNSQAWKNAQTDIAKLSIELANASRQARSIELSQLQATLPEKSLDFLNAKLEKARLSASRLSPNLNSWHNFQKVIGQSEAELEKLERQSNRVRLKQKENALAPGSIARLEVQLQRAQLNLKYAAPDSTRFKFFRDEVKKTELALEKLNAKMRMKERFGAAAGSVLYGGGLAGSPLSALAGVVGGFMGGIPGSFTGAAIGQSADQAIAATKAITDYAASISKLRIALAGVSSGLQGYRANLSAVNDISNKFALSPDKVIMPYTRLQASVKAAGYDVSVTKNAFEAILAASIATGGGIDDLDGSLRALTQVFAKGTVQSEELVGQLSERIPGAFAKFAQANKMSTSELKDALAAGRVGLEEMITFLDKLKADYSKSAATIVQSQEYAGQRMSKAFDDLRANVGSSLVSMGASFQDWATDAINKINGVITALKKLNILSSDLTSSEISSKLLEGSLNLEQVDKKIKELEVKLKSLGAVKPRSMLFPSEIIISSLVNAFSAKGDSLKQFENLTRNLKEWKAAREVFLNLMSDKEAQQAATLYEDQIKKAKSYSEKYYSLIQARDEQLADARESHERRLQEIRLSQAKELSDYVTKLAEDRRQVEIDAERARRSGAMTIADMQDQSTLIEAKMRGEDTRNLEQTLQMKQKGRDIDEDILRRKEDFETKNRLRQTEIEKMRRKNADEINKANRDHAYDIGKIQLKFSRDSKKIFAESAIEFGKTISQTSRYITSLTELTLTMSNRVRLGLHPTREAESIGPLGLPVYSKNEVTEIQRIRKELDSQKSAIFGSKPPPPKYTIPPGSTFDPNKGRGGPDLPDSKLPKAGPTPVGAMPVPGRDNLPSDYFIGEAVNGSRQVNPKHINIPHSERVEAASPEAASDKLKSAGQSLVNQETFNKLLEVEKDYQGVLREIANDNQGIMRSAQERYDLSVIELSLLERGINPAIAEQYATIRKSKEEAIQRLEYTRDQYKQDERMIQLQRVEDNNANELKRERVDLAQEFANKVAWSVNRLREQVNVLEKGLLTQAQANALLAEEYDYRRQMLELLPPGAASIKGQLRVKGIADEPTLSRLADRQMNLESQLKIAGSFKNLGETVNSSLGAAISSLAFDWTNFSEKAQKDKKTLQDVFNELATTITQNFVNSVKDAFKQLADTIIQEFTRAYKDKAVSWFMRTFLQRNPMDAGASPLLLSPWPSTDFEALNPGPMNQFATDAALPSISEFVTKNPAFPGVPRVADGGIAKAPTLGLIGEGRFNEAIIPMPNNRAVPVQLRGDMGGNYATSIAVTVNNSGDGGAQSQMSGDQGNKLAGVLDRAVKDAILSEQRPGGLLYRQ